MKHLIIFSLLLISAMTLQAQNGLEVDKPNGTKAFSVDYSGLVYAYNTITSWSAAYDGFYAYAPAEDGLKIINPGDDGVNITGAPGHGVEINAGTTGLYVHNQANQGIYSDQAGREAGWFRNVAGSSYPCLRVTAGDENVSDISFGGHGRMESQGSFTFDLDNNDNATESFDIIESGGFRIMKISEDLNHHMLGSLALGNSAIHATGYTLSVDGKIMTEEVRVELSQNWPDYVFKEDYELTPLPTLEKEIKTLGHLPGIPAAQVIEKEGFDLGEMNRLLVEKIEELTLHIINLNKEIELIKLELNK